MTLEREADYCLFTLYGGGSTPERAGRDCWEALVGLAGAPDEDDFPESLKDDLTACRAMMQAAREYWQARAEAVAPDLLAACEALLAVWDSGKDDCYVRARSAGSDKARHS